jgi:hypothetical protein
MRVDTTGREWNSVPKKALNNDHFFFVFGWTKLFVG